VQFNHIRNHVIVISEASSALGATCAKMAAQRGARLVLADADEQALGELGRSLRETSAEVSCVVTNPSESDAVGRVIGHALKRYGRMDTWVNSAGIGVLTDVHSVKDLWLWLRAFPVTVSHQEFEHALEPTPELHTLS